MVEGIVICCMSPGLVFKCNSSYLVSNSPLAAASEAVVC